MALTKISRSLLDTGISDSSDATAITIDSSERVGIGESSPDELLVIGGDVKIKSTIKQYKRVNLLHFLMYYSFRVKIRQIIFCFFKIHIIKIIFI